MALSEVAREVLRRDLQRLLYLCRECRGSRTLSLLSAMVAEQDSTLEAVETEARRLYALLNAAPRLLPNASEWVAFHLQALQDIHEVTQHFTSNMPTHTRHVA